MCNLEPEKCNQLVFTYLNKYFTHFRSQKSEPAASDTKNVQPAHF